MKSKNGLLLVISGPSGTGKGTVLKRIIEQRGDIFYSVSATTRAPRAGEIDGVDYYFMTKEEFVQKIREDKMLEYAEYCDNFYGTQSDPIDQSLEKGCDVILEIEVQGAFKVKRKRPEAIMIFMMPPSFKELERRLRSRQTESEEKIRKRLERAIAEMECAKDYDYIVINDTVENAVEDLNAIIKSEKMKAKYMSDIIQGVLADASSQD